MQTIADSTGGRHCPKQLPGNLFSEHVINDVSDAIAIVASNLNGENHMYSKVTEHLKHVFDREDSADRQIPSRYKFPFGVWFRGSGFGCHPLEPSLFRHHQIDANWCECCKRKARVEYFDEVSMVRHFRSVAPHYQRDHTSQFDWLCLMQHYNMPTRLLDWTENILIALYFAVRSADGQGSPETDGVVYALNGARLNQITRLDAPRRMLVTPDSGDVVARSALSQARTKSGFRKVLVENGWWLKLRAMGKGSDQRPRYHEFRQWMKNATSPPGLNGRMPVVERLGHPVAVFPNRLNERLRAQQGVFTLHGGRVCDPNLMDGQVVQYQGEFPEPRSLYALNERVIKAKVAGKRFLIAFRVPRGEKCKRDGVDLGTGWQKKKIREQLKRLGIHEATVFPELDRQGVFISKQWRVKDNEPGRE